MSCLIITISHVQVIHIDRKTYGIYSHSANEPILVQYITSTVYIKTDDTRMHICDIYLLQKGLLLLYSTLLTIHWIIC